MQARQQRTQSLLEAAAPFFEDNLTILTTMTNTKDMVENKSIKEESNEESHYS